jgi:ribosomal protein S18 acetylase RimI-like enzyme
MEIKRGRFVNITIAVAKKPEKDLHKDAIWSLLCRSEDEFFPPLSCRASTTQSELTKERESAPPRAYFNQMIKQDFLLAFQEESLVGFLSFIHNYTNKNILYNDRVVHRDLNNYITTICVDSGSRKHGIAHQLYSSIEACLPECLQTRFVSTRTWSSNKAQNALLRKRGYTMCKRIEDDRKFLGITDDTLYFIKEVQDGKKE